MQQRTRKRWFMVLKPGTARIQVGCASLDDVPFCISQITRHNKIQIFFSLNAPLLHSVLLLCIYQAETVEVIYMQNAPCIVYTNYIIRSSNENFLACLGHLSMR